MEEDNRAFAIRWMDEVWNSGRDATVDELLAREAVGYMEGAEVRGAAEFRAARDRLLQALPDLKIRILRTLAQEDHVAVLWEMSGTSAVPAHRKEPVKVVGTTWFRFAHGRIVEGRDTWNPAAVLALDAG